MLGFIVYLDKKSLIISKCPIPTQSRVFVHGKQSKFVSSILIEYYEDINVVVSYIQSLYLLPYHSQSGSSHTFPRNKDTILMMLIIVYECNDILVAVLRNKCYDIYFFTYLSLLAYQNRNRRTYNLPSASDFYIWSSFHLQVISGSNYTEHIGMVITGIFTK